MKNTPGNLQFLAGGGEMGQLTRAKDWGKTALGEPESWPQSLRTTLGIVLNSKFPMFLWWGPELICFYNDAYRPSLGQDGKHPSILGMQAEKAWPEIWHIIKPLIDQVLAGGEATWSEDQLIPIFRNGKIEDVYWTFSYSPVNDESGEVAGVLVTCNETTDKVITLKKMEESGKRFRSLTESIPQVVWETDEKGNALFASAKWKELTGIVPTGETSWREVLHPDDYEKNKNIWMHSLATGDTYKCDVRIRNRTVEFRWHTVTGEPVYNDENKIIKWVGAFTDIHNERTFTHELARLVEERTKELELLNDSLKKSEKRYHLMVEEVQDYAILYLNREGFVENWNKGAEKIKGYRAEEIIGKNFSSFYTEHDRNNQLPQTLLNRAVLTGRAVQEGWRVRKDGSLFWASVVITAVHNEEGNVIGFSKVTHDLTEKKEADDKLKINAKALEQKNKELEDLNKELQSFAYISSHDLQEPLRKIQTFSTQIIEKESRNLSDSGKDKFQRMQNAAKRMQTLIEDLLTYSRANTAERKFEKTGLTKIVEEVKEDLKEELQQKHATIEAAEMCEVHIIPFQFRQLM
ncbi:MAG TPA: PAS domain S-box protein, partial [Bacteroidia bacterium]|nr:PAS domain S-box protein [Bacteroidia bacterium]